MFCFFFFFFCLITSFCFIYAWHQIFDMKEKLWNGRETKQFVLLKANTLFVGVNIKKHPMRKHIITALNRN
uniref:Putative secreted protein ovary overexpressed n=1 Tax=Rhipicephalus microplus TaxID=6941 RepID=A0A6M2DCI9_RHIMP